MLAWLRACFVLLAGATINFNWIHEQQQAMVVWTVIYAWYSILPFAHPDPRDPVGGMGHGLMSADQPWSGAMTRLLPRPLPPCSSLACPSLLCHTLPSLLCCIAFMPCPAMQ